MNISAGEFKAKCLKLMDEVNQHHHEIIITKHGKPVAKLAPINEAEKTVPIYGCMENTADIVGDIIVSFNENWEADE